MHYLIFSTHFHVSFQGSIYNWVLEHRLHHERRGTALDPFDPRRGFLFAHLNNKLVKPQPELEEVRKTVDMSDLEQDAFVMFQKR